jgi:hypothetical protein
LCLSLSLPKRGDASVPERAGPGAGAAGAGSMEAG